MFSLAVSQANNCKYCISVHLELCSRAPEFESTNIIRARLCEADDPKDQAVLDLAVEIVEQREELPDRLLESTRKSGLSDSTVIEIISNVISVMYEIYINHMAKTDID